MLQVREYKADLAKLQESSKGAVGSAAGGASARAELGLSDNYSTTSAGQRERLLQTTDKMSKTGERITQGRQQLLETEASVLVSLHGRLRTETSCSLPERQLILPAAYLSHSFNWAEASAATIG